MAALTRGAIATVVVIVGGGCGGGEEQRVFTSADAERIANVRPVADGWNWPQNPEHPVPSTSSNEVGDTDPLLVELNRQMADVVGAADVGNKWRDGDKLGNLVAQVYGSTADAQRAIAALNAFSRGWGERSGEVTKDERIDGLGDEAWLLWVGGNGTQVTYHWRRGNLVLEAHVHCYGVCTGDVDAATRAWVDRIDENARTGG